MPQKEKVAPQKREAIRKKLSYNEQRELNGMEGAIRKKETEIAQIEKELAEATSEESLKLYTLLASSQQDLEALFARWEFLESKK